MSCFDGVAVQLQVLEESWSATGEAWEGEGGHCWPATETVSASKY